ncbi:MAG: signal recognition particle-docking protein FtsY [candidate division WS1 bacterium]|nr:signal recognition particle-docking protein FtsY [candidate division WS1 bacterium]
MLKGLFKRVAAVFTGRAVIDEDLLEDLEAALIQADVSATLAVKLVEELREQAERGKLTTPDQLRQALQEQVAALLQPYEAPLNKGKERPTVFLILGVNGTGKTTTIGKLAYRYQRLGQKVMLVAADTFRAAAAEQLKIWAERAGCDIVAQQSGADPAAVAYDGVKAAQARGHNLVIVDTAGRLHTKVNLMEELKKIGRVIERELGRLADERLLVLDATIGQNALFQARQFHEGMDLTGLAVAKLDGSAKAGIVLTITQELKLPIKLIGTGEKPEDLEPFSAARFAEQMFAE